MKTPAQLAACGGGKSPRGMWRRPAAGHQNPPLAAGRPARAARTTSELAIAEHLQLQRAIEERAHGLWLAENCAAGIALDHWLRAETEALTEFVAARWRRPTAPAAPARKPKAAGRAAPARMATTGKLPVVSNLNSPAANRCRL